MSGSGSGFGPNSSSGPGKISDTTHGGGHPNSHGTFTSPDGGITNGRLPSRPGSGSNVLHYGGTNTGSNSNLPNYGGRDGSQDKSQPIRSGSYDLSGNGRGPTDSGRTQPGNGLQTYDQTRDRGSSSGKPTINSFDQSEGKPTPNGGISGGGGTGGNNGNGGSLGQQSTDALSGFRKIFKLPPGLCLVRCDTLKPGQVLTTEQIRDAFASSGLIGKFNKHFIAFDPFKTFKIIYAKRWPSINTITTWWPNSTNSTISWQSW